jgi:hypothetical protein
MSELWRAIGDYELKRVEITTTNNQVLNIKTMIKSMTIWEDMFGVFMSGQIKWTDAAGYSDKLPINGNEKIVIEFQTPGTEKSKVYTFYIYYMSGDNVVGPDQKQESTINMCSLEMMANPLMRVSKSLKGTQSDLAEAVFTENFGNFGKSITVEQTLTEIKMNIPAWTAGETICWLSNHAVSKATGSPSYVFFENANGFYFTSIEKLKRSVPHWEFYSEANKNNPLDMEYNVTKVLGLTMNKNTNVLSSIQSGAFGTRTVYQDAITKQTKTVDYQNDVEPTLSKSTSMMPSVLSSLASGSTQHTTYRTVNEELFEKGEKSTSATTQDWEGRRRAYLSQLFQNRITINVTGNTLIDTGEVVTLYVKDQSGEGWNKAITGNYLVTAIAHNISPQGHYMAIELMTDGSNGSSGGISG